MSWVVFPWYKLYRHEFQDAKSSVTRTAILDARRKEIRQEVLNDQKLKTYFEDNPRDLQVIRHNKQLGVKQLPASLKNVPDYAGLWLYIYAIFRYVIFRS